MLIGDHELARRYAAVGERGRAEPLIGSAREAARLQGAWPWVQRCDAALAAEAQR